MPSAPEAPHVPLERVIELLEGLAPLRLAGDWDNVGLLLHGTRPVRRLFVAIDLTEAVLAEAIAGDADLIVSYHPPIFRGLKRITERTPGGRIVLECVRSGLHVYSPHTALDAATGGMAEWLLDAVGPTTDASPIAPDVLDPTVGAGRVGDLGQPTPLRTVIDRVKDQLGLAHVRVAAAPDRWEGTAPITRAAACPGAGGSVLADATDADLWLSGELRHHDILARVARGGAVIVADHTNTERGYLPLLAGRLRDALDLPVHVSEVDADPLTIV